MRITPMIPINFSQNYRSISDMKKAQQIKQIAENSSDFSMYEPGFGIDIYPLAEVDKRIPSRQNVEEDFLKEQDEKHLLELVENLPEEQSNILKRRFGLGDFEAQTRKEVAKEIGMTENMVRNRENAALLALKITLTKEQKIMERETKTR